MFLLTVIPSLCLKAVVQVQQAGSWPTTEFALNGMKIKLFFTSQITETDDFVND